jgi:hypothetical protein
MKIKAKQLATLLIVGSVIGVCGAVHAMGTKPKGEAQEKAATQMIYACPTCEAMSLIPGKCPGCKMDMQAMHLLGTKDGQAMACTCPEGCTCDAKGVKNSKCACGKPVEMVSCKGMYVCSMGCPIISARPGKCACDMEMEKVD